MATTTYTPPVRTWASNFDGAADKASQAADAAVAELGAEHGIDWSSFPYQTCTCGRSFRNPQGLGIHRTAESKKADKVWASTWDKAYAAAKAEAR